MGVHVVGGAFGFLCRQLGLAADYLYGIEVVTIDEAGRAKTVIATREASDPNRDLWWAHTGAGGGNFGTVTRYWFRSPGASGEDPATLLPPAPQSNTVAPDATASPPRRAIFDLACTTGWLDPTDDAQNLASVRAFCRELFADTGGAPVPGDAYDGALINHPDVDLADPALNGSGVPWPTFYYQTNYSRLQRIKAQWDPLNVFRHALSIRAEG